MCLFMRFPSGLAFLLTVRAPFGAQVCKKCLYQTVIVTNISHWKWYAINRALCDRIWMNKVGDYQIRKMEKAVFRNMKPKLKHLLGGCTKLKSFEFFSGLVWSRTVWSSKKSNLSLTWTVKNFRDRVWTELNWTFSKFEIQLRQLWFEAWKL